VSVTVIMIILPSSNNSDAIVTEPSDVNLIALAVRLNIACLIRAEPTKSLGKSLLTSWTRRMLFDVNFVTSSTLFTKECSDVSL
jgi:hypothetical protein